MAFRTVVVGIDESAASDAAVRVARRLAHPDATFLLAHGIDVAALAVSEAAALAVLTERREEAARQLLAERRRAAGLAHAEAALRWGPPSTVLRDLAVERRADLVAVGRHGSLLGRLGSTAVGVLRATKAAVLVASAPAPPELRRILVATDFGEASTRAARTAVAVARSLGAKLAFVHVETTEPRVGEGARGGAEEARRRLAEQDEDALARFLGETGAPADATRVVRHGDSLDGILAAAKEGDADLVVVGTHGPGFVERLVLGSVAERVAERASMPVLVVR